MHFEESDEEKMFREMVREFAQKHVAPEWQKYDGETHEIPRDLIKKMADQMLWAPTVSEEYGGANLSWVMACIAAEELAKADLSIALPVMYLVEALKLHGPLSLTDMVLQRQRQNSSQR